MTPLETEEPQDQPLPGTAKPLVRITLVLASLFTAWHVFASFLWISPPSELRTVVPGQMLSSYMLPWYGQSWSVFAPEPINGDYKFEVRAIVEDGVDDDGATTYVATDWVDATDAELSMSKYNLFPPRAATLSTQQASKHLNLWKKLTPEQKEIVKLGYYEGDAWLARMRAALTEVGDQPQTVTDYIVQERYSAAYATQVAFAVWGEEGTTQVQFRVSRQNVVPFEKRNDPAAERPAPEMADLGWRGLIVMPGQSAENFAHVFAGLPAQEENK